MSELKRGSTLLKVFRELVEIFDSKSGRTALFVAMGVIIFYQNNTINKLQNARLEDSESRRNSEVEIYMKLVDRFDPEMKRMKREIDSSRVVVDSAVNQVNPLLEKISNHLTGETKK